MKYRTLVVAFSLAGVLSACGNESSAPATNAAITAESAATPVTAEPMPAPATPAPAAQAIAVGAVDGGKIYNNTCALCHAAGVAGAIDLSWPLAE